jgi:hypothetical protein
MTGGQSLVTATLIPASILVRAGTGEFYDGVLSL